MRQIQRPQVLHVASHGYFRSHDAPFFDDPGDTRSQLLRPGSSRAADQAAFQLAQSPLLLSGLVLAGANLPPTEDDNGLLTAAELANLDLRGTKLVVLSGCETGTGEIRNGDGVLGLRRGAVLAGARAQVVSLWQVDDRATAFLMKAFYRHLRKGRTVGEALQAAKAKVRSRPEWSHPFYWSAFTVSGNAQTTL